MSSSPGRSRAKDWWRWITIIPGLGGLLAAGGLLTKRRWGWALVIALATLASIVLLASGGAKVHDAQQAGYGASGGGYLGNDPVGYSQFPYSGLLSAYHEHQQGTLLAGWGAILWWLTISVGWLVPSRQARRSRRPWPEVTERARQFTVTYGLIAYCVSFGVVVALTYILRAVGAHLGVGVGVLSVDAILLAGLLPLISQGKLGRRDIGLRSTRAGAAAGLAVGAFVLYLLLSAGYSLLFIHANSTLGKVSGQYNITSGPGTLAITLDCFAMAISAPVCEEIFFRGVLYRCLRNRMGLWPAALIAGCLFGLVHITSYPLVTIPIKMLFGVLMCLLYERTRSLLPTIAVHAAVDGSAADFIFTGNLDVALICMGAALIAVLLRVSYNAFRDHQVSRAAFLTATYGSQAVPGAAVDGGSAPAPGVRVAQTRPASLWSTWPDEPTAPVAPPAQRSADSPTEPWVAPPLATPRETLPAQSWPPRNSDGTQTDRSTTPARPTHTPGRMPW